MTNTDCFTSAASTEHSLSPQAGARVGSVPTRPTHGSRVSFHARDTACLGTWGQGRASCEGHCARSGQRHSEPGDCPPGDLSQRLGMFSLSQLGSVTTGDWWAEAGNALNALQGTGWPHRNAHRAAVQRGLPGGGRSPPPETNTVSPSHRRPRQVRRSPRPTGTSGQLGPGTQH